MQLSLMQLIRAQRDRSKSLRPLTVPSATFLRCARQPTCQQKQLSSEFSKVAKTDILQYFRESRMKVGLLVKMLATQASACSIDYLIMPRNGMPHHTNDSTKVVIQYMTTSPPAGLIGVSTGIPIILYHLTRILGV